MLDIRGLTVRYGDTTAVDAVDLTVSAGEVLALLGPSGCGKSTLLRAIAGLETPSAGRIRWDGVDLARVPVHRRRFGLMFQDGVLFPHRTVAGNVAYGLKGQRDARARVDELLTMVGLPDYGPRRVSTLSGGEAQRVALARALAPRPQLLMLDEPLAALDRSLRDGLLADLRRVLRTTGTTAILVTHDQTEAFAIADRLAVMRAGRIVQVGSPAEIWRHPVDEVTARFLGCTSIIGTEDAPFPLAAGPGERVGLRPAALVVDGSGPLRAEIVDSVPGPEHVRLTVRDLVSAAPIVQDDGAQRDAATDDGTPAAAAPATDDGPRLFAAIGPVGGRYVPGEAVTLRLDPDQLAWISAPPDGAEPG